MEQVRLSGFVVDCDQKARGIVWKVRVNMQGHELHRKKFEVVSSHVILVKGLDVTFLLGTFRNSGQVVKKALEVNLDTQSTENIPLSGEKRKIDMDCSNKEIAERLKKLLGYFGRYFQALGYSINLNELTPVCLRFGLKNEEGQTVTFIQLLDLVGVLSLSVEGAKKDSVRERIVDHLISMDYTVASDDNILPGALFNYPVKDEEAKTILTNRFFEALVYFTKLHQQQIRKGSRIAVPYVAHLFAVASLVMEAGGDEDECIAALGHDAVEDQGGLERLKEIQSMFGDRVAKIILGCSETCDGPKPPWKVRREKHIHDLSDASFSVLLVTAADKLHNARCLLLSLREENEEVWTRFNASKDEVLWYYRSITAVLKEVHWTYMVQELQYTVTEIHRLALSEKLGEIG